MTSSATRQRTEPEVNPEYRTGVLFGAAAYGMWGLFPLFWTLLEPANEIEILAHRMAWSLVAVLGVLWFVGWRRGTGLSAMRTLLRDRRKVGLLAIAAVLIGTNWGAYIWGVNNGHVVETALGYFTGPLVSVLIGVLLLGERLRVWQWIAVGLGVVAIIVLIAGYGQVPWLALLLAFSFATYGLVKKKVGTGAVESLAVETGVTLLPAIVYIGLLEGAGNGTFATNGVGHALLLVAGGIVTTLPLLAFGGAAVRIPLSLIGLLQYMTPTMQFAIGVLVFHEQMPAERWLGFAVVWLALIVLTTDTMRHARSQRHIQPPC